PLPDQLEVDKCYTSWRVELTTPEQKESIADVFLFVKDRSRIEIEEVKGMSLPGDKGIPDWFFREKPEEILRRLRDKAGTGEKQAVRAGFRTEDSLQLSLSTIRVDSHDVDVYVNLVSELITAQSRLFALAGTRTDPELEALAEHFDKLIHQLRDNAFEMGMIPLISMGTHFKRLVRDLSAELKKKVRLVLTGLDTEVDKQVIEKLATPMIHLIRNSIDHGIESPEQRVRAGKSEEGTVTVSAGYDGNQVEIRVRDDGAGLDLAKIRETAVRLGITGGQEQSQEAGWYDFIFRPGFSTSEQVNDVSGRGVGLDAARKVIRDLNGDLSVETKAGGGSCFVIRVPLSMSVIDGLKVRVNEQLYLIPSSHVQQIFPFKNNPDEDRIRQVHLAEGKQIPYLDLSMLFYGLSSSLRRYLLAVKYRDGLFGLVVDDVLGERQTVVKPVDAMQHDRSIFLGASILGNGQVALILDVKKIIQKMAG
ncbi:MAG: chemotaxis protein CheA, partial [Mangrovibacterium sp.]